MVTAEGIDMAVRRNILNDTQARNDYIRGVLLLKQEMPAGSQFSTYDLFVRWHHTGAMHWRSAFLPWHRHFLIEFERALQRILGNTNFGLPYWAWNSDGDKPPAQQLVSRIWSANCMGGSGTGPNRYVRTGPFAFNPANANSFRVKMRADFGNPLQFPNDGLQRTFPDPTGRIASTARVKQTIAQSTYDRAPWRDVPSSGFRGAHEPDHGMVHVWIGGDMRLSTSPNDPVFYLHHSNIDRIWEAWKLKNPGKPYLPQGNTAGAPAGDRVTSRLQSIVPNPPTIASMVNVANIYTYDSIADLFP